MPGGDPTTDDDAAAAVDPDQLERVTKLLAARPDLVGQRVESVSQLQNVAAWGVNLRHCVSHLNQFDVEVLETLFALGPRLPEQLVDDLNVDAADIETAAQRLLERWLVRYDGPKLRTTNLDGLGNQHPAGLGLSLSTLADSVSPFTMKSILAAYGINGTASKIDNIAALHEALSDADALKRVIADAPVEAQQMLHQLVTVSPRIRIEYGRSPNRGAIEWLARHGLLFESNWNEYQIPREAGIALRNGRVVTEAHPTPPLLTIDGSTTEEIDAHAAFEISKFVAKINHLLVLIDTDPPRALNNDGMSVKDVKRLATALDVSERHMSILLELVVAAGLIARRTAVADDGKQTRRNYQETIRFISTTTRAEKFEKWSLGKQWIHLVRTWLATAIHLSDSGQKDASGKLINTLSQPAWRSSPALCQRSALIDTLVRHFPQQITSDATQFADFMAWDAHQLYATDDNGIVIEQLLDEAEMLCIYERGALTAAANTLIAGDIETVESAITANAPQPVERFTVQADASVMIGGTPSPGLLSDLLAFSDVESRDAAWIVRITEPSIRRAIDNGAKIDDLIEFLRERSDREVPQSVTYLIEDVGRRHGNVVIGPADSFITTTDAAILSDIVRNKSLTKLGLRQIAPTVAVASVNQQKLLVELRKAGFMPTLGEGATEVERETTDRPKGTVSFETKHINHSAAGTQQIARKLLENSPATVDDEGLDVQGVLTLFTTELRQLGVINEDVELQSNDVVYEGIRISAMALQAVMDRTPLLFEAIDDDGKYLDMALAKLEQGSLTLHSLLTDDVIGLNVKKISWMMTISTGPNREARLFND